MHQDVKNQWVTALRSGEYQQSTGHLRDKEGYCCLGVLCELAVEADIIPASVYYDEYHDIREFAGETQFLPEIVQEWAGLDDKDPYVRVTDVIDDSLSNLNDGGHNFTEIAEYIVEGIESDD